MPHIGNFPGPGYPRPLVIPHTAFVPFDDQGTWSFTGTMLNVRTGVTFNDFWAPVSLPQGATIKKLTLWGARTTEASTLRLELYRLGWNGSQVQMALVIADWSDGMGSGYDDTITSPLVDNENHQYVVKARIDPEADPIDCQLQGATIDWN